MPKCRHYNVVLLSYQNANKGSLKIESPFNAKSAVI
jgi:hypothetical protein